MKKKDWNDGLNYIRPELIKKFIEQKDKNTRKMERRQFLLRFAATVACLALLVTGIVVGTKFSPDSNSKYVPKGEPWTPVLDSSITEVSITADHVAELMKAYASYGSTNQYIKIYTNSLAYEDILPLPKAEYLPIYFRDRSKVDIVSLKAFINKYIDPATKLTNIGSRGYVLQQEEWEENIVSCWATITGVENSVTFNTSAWRQTVVCDARYGEDDRMLIQGKYISLLETDSDAQIKKKLKKTIAYICDLFDMEYTDIQITRSYSEDMLFGISVSLYTREDTALSQLIYGLRASKDIILHFNTAMGRGSAYNWEGSKNEAFLTRVVIREVRNNWMDDFKITKAPMISLKEAEDLLDKGYVFGGHSCPKCMSEQPEVDFSDYTCVGIEYLNDKRVEQYMPFYAFYKYIGETEYGIGTYAKTYVPAVKVEGMEEYFMIQADKHPNR